MSEIAIKATPKGVTLFLVLVIVILLLIGGGTYMFWNKISEATAKMEAKKKQVEESQRIASTLEDSKLEYEDVQAQLRNLEQSVSTQAYIPTLLKQVEALCQSVDMRVISVRPVKVVETKTEDTSTGKDSKTSGSSKDKPSQSFYNEQKIDLELGGNYLNALDFTYKLTSFPKIIAVNSVQMSPVTTSGLTYVGSPALKVQMSVTAFILNESEPVMTADKSVGENSETR